jgi:hypothetical protein
MLRFAADQSEVRVARLGDLSRKRNLGLYLAHLCSWRTLLLLDDDIRELSLRTVRWATETLPSGGVTGMLAQDFPDNSVVCHARRAAGLPQRVFISGSALLVDTTRVDSYFPEVYNEDWLFMHDRIRAGRASALGSVRQLRYEPYDDPRRAAGEEFGDTLAEGLMSLAHTGWPAGGASMAKWWSEVLCERRSMLERLIEALPDGDSGNAVLEARKQHDYLTADFFADYVESWRQDLVDFPTRLLDVRGGMPLPDAVAHLRLVGCQHTGERFLEPGGMVVHGLPAAAS